MNTQFITADEARTKTSEKLNSIENPFLKKIFEDGIYPAIEEGNFNCSVKFNCKVPYAILSILQDKGYRASYGKLTGLYTQDERYEKIVNISW